MLMAANPYESPRESNHVEAEKTSTSSNRFVGGLWPQIAVAVLCINSVAVAVATFTVTLNVVPFYPAWLAAAYWTMFVVPPTSLAAPIVLFLQGRRFLWAAAWCVLGVITLVLAGYVYLMMVDAYMSF